MIKVGYQLSIYEQNSSQRSYDIRRLVKLKYVLFIVFLWSFDGFGNTHQMVTTTSQYVSCRDDSIKYKLRSDELQRIVAVDQSDRVDNVISSETLFRDRERRERIASIFGEGCFKEAKDFAAAALVFQHGDQPEHFFQTYIWAKRAVELGDKSQQELMAMGIDRYLVNTGHKQLFATQFIKLSNELRACWYLYQTEATFPDRIRVQYSKTYQQKLEYLKELNEGLNCPLEESAQPLLPTPAGTVPGIW